MKSLGSPGQPAFALVAAELALALAAVVAVAVAAAGQQLSSREAGEVEVAENLDLGATAAAVGRLGWYPHRTRQVRMRLVTTTSTWRILTMEELVWKKRNRRAGDARRYPAASMRW